MAMSKHQLAGSQIKKTLTIEEKVLTNRQGTVTDSYQINFALGRPLLPKLLTFLKNEASFCQEHERFRGNLKRNRKRKDK